MKRTLQAMLIALVAIMMPIGAWAQVKDITVTIDTGNEVTLKDANGDGSYDIGTADELYAFAAAVNSGNNAINGELTANIVVNQNVLVDGALNRNTEGFRVWTPIGYYTSAEDEVAYVGIFDGGKHTVSGLYFNNNTINKIGLFGDVSTNGKVTNVGVVDSYFYGLQNVGGVVGYNTGTVQNCYNMGTVSGGNNVGGVVGYNYEEGTVQNCYNMGTVSSDKRAGGVAARNWGGSVTDCYNAGTVNGGNDVGGVVGNGTNDTIEHCYNTGDVSGSNNVGGIIGYQNGGNTQNCYNTGAVSGSKHVGGIVGYFLSGTVENCYNANSVSGTQNFGGVIGSRYSSSVVSNSYFDSTKHSGSAIGLDEGTTADVGGKTSEQFASGEVAYLLGSAFGQNIDNGKTVQTVPVLSGAAVYSIQNCKNETLYSNTNENVGHQWGNGTCTVCGAACDHDDSEHTTATNNGDGTHDATCTVCGGTVTEAHTYNDETGFCNACGALNPNATKVVLTDGALASFSVPSDMALETLTYTRTLPNTEWNALYVPFEVEVTEALLAQYDVAYANNMHAYDTDDNGTIDELEMEVIKIKQGTLHANHPYFIRAKSEAARALTLTVEDAVLYATESVAMTCQSFYTTFTLTGTYSAMDAADFAAIEGTHYAIATEGGWWRTEGLNPFRVYMTITEREGSPVKVSAEAMARVRIVTRGEETTGIDNGQMTIDNEASGAVYDLQGRRVAHPTKGVYIVNGRKVIF